LAVFGIPWTVEALSDLCLHLCRMFPYASLSPNFPFL
jgi:hypothetical protein